MVTIAPHTTTRRLAPGVRRRVAAEHYGFIWASIGLLRRSGLGWSDLARRLNSAGRDDPSYLTFTGKPWTAQNLQQRMSPKPRSTHAHAEN